MNGDFEKSGTYPFATVPVAGYGNPNPTGEYVITNINRHGEALQVGDFGHRYVTFDKGTRFKDAVEATRAIGQIKQ